MKSEKNQEKKRFDERMKNELSNQEVTPPSHVWINISEKLNSNLEGIKKMNRREEGDVKAS